MRMDICFAVAFAVLAAVSARADERSAKWVGRWTFATQYTATPETFTLKESGGKMTGGAEFGGDCYYFHHGRDGRQHVTGVRQV